MTSRNLSVSAPFITVAGATDASYNAWYVCGAGDLNSDAHACLVGTLPNEPSPRSLSYILTVGALECFFWSLNGDKE